MMMMVMHHDDDDDDDDDDRAHDRDDGAGDAGAADIDCIVADHLMMWWPSGWVLGI